MNSKPIRMGRKGEPIDLTEWNERCRERLGGEIAVGKRLSKAELRALGFSAAAGDTQLRTEVSP